MAFNSNLRLLAIFLPASLWLVLPTLANLGGTTSNSIQTLLVLLASLFAFLVLAWRQQRRRICFALCPFVAAEATLLAIGLADKSNLEKLVIQTSLNSFLLLVCAPLILSSHSERVSSRKFLYVVITIQLVFMTVQFFDYSTTSAISPVDRFEGSLVGKGGTFAPLLVAIACMALTLAVQKLLITTILIAIATCTALLTDGKMVLVQLGLFLVIYVTSIQVSKTSIHQRLRRLMQVMIGILLFATYGWLALSGFTLADPTSAGDSMVHHSILKMIEDRPAANENAKNPNKTPDDLFPGYESATQGSQGGSKMRLLVEALAPDSNLWAELQHRQWWGLGAGRAGSKMWNLSVAETSRDPSADESQINAIITQTAGGAQADQSVMTQPSSSLLGIRLEFGLLGLLAYSSIAVFVVFMIAVIAGTRSALCMTIPLVPLFVFTNYLEVPGFVCFLGVCFLAAALESDVKSVRNGSFVNFAR